MSEALRRFGLFLAFVCTCAPVCGVSPAGAQAPSTDAGELAPAPVEQPSVDSSPSSPSASTVELARSAYARGQAAFAAGDFATAQSAFEEAYSHVPNPIVLISIAESAAQQGRIDVAVAKYDQYLQLQPDAADREQVMLKREALSAQLSRWTISSEPAGALVSIDGQSTGQVTPTTFALVAGTHRAELMLEGHVAAEVSRQLAPSERVDQVVQLMARPPEQPVPPPQEAATTAATSKPESASNGSSPTAAIITTAAIGAVGLIAGTTLGIMALNARSDYNRAPTESKADRGERLALFSDVGFGMGAMALITTGVLLLTRDDAAPAPAKDKEAARAARWSLTPQVSANGAAATAELRF